MTLPTTPTWEVDTGQAVGTRGTAADPLAWAVSRGHEKRLRVNVLMAKTYRPFFCLPYSK
jgi:hypothetical protein